MATNTTSVMRKKLVRRINNNYGISSELQLPDEIWIEILLYLTAKDLHSCKTVSKQLYFLISNPHFVNTHLNKQSQQILITTTTKPTTLIPYHQFDYFSIINNGSGGMNMIITKPSQLEFPPTTTTTKSPAKNLCLLASCDGLLLFRNKYDPRLLYISNPATSLFMPLTPLTHDYRTCHWALVRNTLTNKYKVFGFPCRYRFVLLTLGDKTPGQWSSYPLENTKHVPTFEILSQFILSRQNDLLWLTTDYQDADNVFVTNQNCYCIYSINVHTLMFNKIKIPLHVWKLCPYQLFDFGVAKGLHLLSEVKGSLYLTAVSKFKLNMFVLQDRLNSVWTKSHTISLHSLSNLPTCLKSFMLDYICLVPMTAVDPSNLTDLVKVVIHYEDQLLLYDLNRQECTEIGFLKKGQKLCRPYYFHSDSLVSLNSDRPFFCGVAKLLPTS